MPLSFKGWRLYRATQQLRDDARALQAQVQMAHDRQSLLALGPLLSQARVDVANLRSEAALLLPAAQHLGWVPGFGAELAAAQPLLDGALEFTTAADELFGALSPLVEASSATPPAAADLGQQLSDARPRLTTARGAIVRAQAAWAQIDVEALTPEVRAPLERAMPLLPLAQGGLDLALAAPQLLDDLGQLNQVLQQRPDRTRIMALGPLLAKARADAAQAQGAAALFETLGQRLAGVPGYGAELAAAGPLLRLGGELTSAADLALKAFAPLLRAQPSSEMINLSLAKQLAQVRPELGQASAALARADAQLRRIPIASLSPAWRAGLEQVAALLPALRDSVDVAFVLPDMLGVDGRREYLLLAQNNDELRATGGFINGAGVLAVDGGKLTDFSFGDSVNVDDLTAHPYPLAPAPLLRYMRSELWLFRDSNWSPDFPTAARAAIDLYRLGQGRSPANVVAFDQTFIQSLVAVTGPLDVDGYTYPITAANVVQEMRAPSFMPSDEGREEFKRRLARALVLRLGKSGSRIDLIALAQAVRRGLNERHLQIFIQGPVGDLFAAHGWDGAVQPGQSDFMMVVDSNVGYNKVNPNIRQAITYTVDLADPHAPLAELAIAHTNRSTAQAGCSQRGGAPLADGVSDYSAWMNSCYYDYLRVLLPPGSLPIAAQTQPTPADWLMSQIDDDGAMDISEGDGGTSVWGTFLVVPEGATRTTVLRYRLPASALTHDAQGWHYHLQLQKQPGTLSADVAVRLRLPAAATYVSANPAPVSNDNGVLVISAPLDVDRAIDVTFTTK